MSALEWLRWSGENENVIELASVIYANDFGTSLSRLGVQEMKVHFFSIFC
jgi:hypothetical protein